MTLAETLLLAVHVALNYTATWKVAFVHDGAPQSKARARVFPRNGKMVAVTPTATRAAEDALAWGWKAALRGKTYEGPLAVSCVFYRPNYQRIDTDNLMKLVLDAGTKARAWEDDCQVVLVVGRTEFDADRPRTEIVLMPTVSTMNRPRDEKRTCESCSSPFVYTKQARFYASGRFCSYACAMASKKVMVRCVLCDGAFRRRRQGQRFCSHACASTLTRAEAVSRGKRLGPPRCSCGERVSRREYRQCWRCLGRSVPGGRSAAT